MTIKDDLTKLRNTKMVHHNWYRSEYPDVLALNMASTEHYLRFGAAMGRMPNPGFDTKYYLSQVEELDPLKENPVLHYAARQLSPNRVQFPLTEKEMMSRLHYLRHQLLTLGLTAPAEAELRDLAQTAPFPEVRAKAHSQIALWYMDDRTPEKLKAALVEINFARETAEGFNTQAELTAAEMMCHYLMGDNDRARAVYEAGALRGEANSDAMLIRANLEENVETRLAIINAVLERHDITPIGLLPNDPEGPDLPIYDRLTSAVELPAVTDGPLVTVLIASYNAGTTLGTALRSLREQTWRNLQIIVIDDCSPDPESCAVVEEYARLDPRIEFIRMERNGGAYVARNRGLDLAKGKYVTLHDADDWSHPHKIEFQVRYMEEHPEIMGSTTQQARATQDMMFNRWSGDMKCLKINVSSFMFRREPMREALGYWDTVRFAADSELLARMKTVFGKESIARILTGPLSFQRDSDSSIVADDVLGMRGFYFGVRKEYLDLQTAYHSSHDYLKYDNDRAHRPFPVPRPMHPDRGSMPEKPHFDVIIASDFRMSGGNLHSCMEEIRASVAAGLRVGVIFMFRYDLEGRKKITALAEVRELIDGQHVQSLVYGEEASCDLLIVRYPPVLQHVHRYLPKIEASDIRVIINQPPVSDYGTNGVLRYRLTDCARNLREMFGKNGIWHPIGPKIREALLEHHADELSAIQLSNEDWVNLIDTAAWSRGDYLPDPSRPIRIGRHSRDHAMKWPDSAATIAKVYPSSKDFEVHVLGGVSSIKHLLPAPPPNWTVHPFDSVEPSEFLAGLDVFVYFHNPDWVESFGRTIFEAMAVGVPVVLAPEYRDVFGDTALYATPDEVQSVVKALCADPVLYRGQVARAQAYVSEHYGYPMHAKRLKAIQEELERKGLLHVEAEPQAPELETATVPTTSELEAVVDSAAITPAAINTTAAQLADEVNLFEAKDADDTVKSAPIKAVKVSLAKLSHIPVLGWPTSELPADESRRIEFKRDGLRYDMMWVPAENPEHRQRLFVLFSGRVYRDKMDPPVFQRWTWANRFPGNCLYVSDPSLWLNPNLGLAWYSGTVETDPMVVIVETIAEIARMRGIAPRDVYTYGSSGGGFAALRATSMLDGAGGIAINPQVNFLDYMPRLVKLCVDTCFDGMSREILEARFPERVSLLPLVHKLLDHRMIYAQNRLDAHHFGQHYQAFCVEAGAPASANEDRGRFRRILFDEQGGHAAAETQEVLDRILEIVTTDTDWT